MKFAVPAVEDPLSPPAEKPPSTNNVAYVQTVPSGVTGSFLMFPNVTKGVLNLRSLDDITEKLASATLHESSDSFTSPLPKRQPNGRKSASAGLKPRRRVFEEVQPEPDQIDEEAAQRRRERIEREAVAVAQGEREYVRIGGILWDDKGNRDFAKTERIRKELKEEEEMKETLRKKAEEERIMREALEQYDKRWADLLHPTTTGTPHPTLTFDDVPWPSFTSPQPEEDLNISVVSEFLFSPLRPTPKNRKEILRESILRWHPDKFEGRVLAFVQPQDAEAVRQLSAAVMQSLRRLMDEDNLGQNVS
ncbi:hypothetical protein SISNIDRAFT_482062 [Sistotremastrum niveocremeum HHB9708]|uniref:Uncharacterized protein n=2 Tax=Sistotremastraceae TaxID=3402574 RepID=A0A164YQ09_9AGAM|nr:hypothetical protein SISNIDRAFT_482062 [Sistotremastrum niveocremeum HHB9708]